MSWRIKRENRCTRCYMRSVLCLCSEIPQIQTRNRLTLLIHHREADSLSNTGRLGVLSLKNSVSVKRGEIGKQISKEELIPEGYAPLLLYPTSDAVELTEDLVKSIPSPISLIVPDGNWRQAGKMSHREVLLKNVPRVKIASSYSSEYLLRREHREEGMCTMEAIARAFGVLEGKEVQMQLEELFKKMNYRVYWSRGKMTKDEAKNYLPESMRE